MIIIVYLPSESFILKSAGGSGFWLLLIVIIVFIYYYSFNVCVTSSTSVQLSLTTTCALALASLAPVTRSGTRRLDVSPACPGPAYLSVPGLFEVHRSHGAHGQNHGHSQDHLRDRGHHAVSAPANGG